jgi:glycosyltransferase involved in cell wall biosynthesis
VDNIFLRQLKDIAPLILTVHDTSLSRTKNVSSFLQTVGWRKALTYLDKFIVHTQSSREKLLQYGIDYNRILLFPHPVLPTSAGAGESAQKNADGMRTLMIFGEIKPYKGIDIALKALALISRELRNKIKLVIAGRPRIDVSKLKQLADNLGVNSQVMWRPEYIPHEDLPALLTTADILLLPYRSIDASGVLATVLAYGKPIIASRLGVFLESAEKDRYGILVNPEDPLDLAHAIENLLTDDGLYETLGAHARQADL